MSANIAAFVAAFIFVALKAFQQLNVATYQYKLVMPTSMLMALCEVYVIAQIAMSGFGWIVVWIGAGSGLGCIFAMWFHKKVINERSGRSK